jgi:aspartyl/asparaginyl beta-hydroxylase (cupin superfamily)
MILTQSHGQRAQPRLSRFDSLKWEVVSKLFGYFYELGLVGKRLKRWHRRSYYLLKWSIVVAPVYWVVRF